MSSSQYTAFISYRHQTPDQEIAKKLHQMIETYTVPAALRQDAAIRKLLKRVGLDALPEPLRDTALLRLANPEASLADLALLSNPPVTKSCLSHRLNRIIALAEQDEG